MKSYTTKLEKTLSINKEKINKLQKEVKSLKRKLLKLEKIKTMTNRDDVGCY